MKKANFILCLLTTAVFILQFVFMCVPFFNYTPQPTLPQKLGKEPMPEPQNISLAGYISVDYPKLIPFMIEKVIADEDAKVEAGVITEEERTMPTKGVKFPSEDQKDALGLVSNDHVMGLVIPLVCGLTMAVMSIFTRKSIVAYLFNLVWAFYGLFSILNPSFAMLQGNTAMAPTVLSVLTYTYIAGVVLTLARLVPIAFTRFMPYKLPLKTNLHEKNWYVA